MQTCILSLVVLQLAILVEGGLNGSSCPSTPMQDCSAPRGRKDFDLSWAQFTEECGLMTYPGRPQTLDGSYFWDEDPALLNRSRVVLGDLYRIQTVLKKASSGQCLKLLIIGGSLCQGRCLDPREKNFFDLLLDQLNRDYPCSTHPSGHSGVNLCQGGTPSSTHVYDTRRHIQQHSPVDLVLLSFACNDFSWPELDDIRWFKPNWPLEYMVRKWYSSGTAVLFVQTGLRFSREADGSTMVFNAEAMHLPFQEAFQVPTVSFSKAILPEFWTHWLELDSRYSLLDIFADHRYHMRQRGHAILATMVFRNLVWMESQPTVECPLELPEQLQFIPQEFYDRLEEETLFQTIFTFHWFQRNELSVSGVDIDEYWELSGEGRNKWGFVSVTPGARMYVRLPGGSKSVFINYMRSYERVGKFNVSFTGCLGDREGAVEVDCLWKEGSTQIVTSSFRVPNEGCDGVVMTVLDAGRVVNKVKIASVSITRPPVD